MNRNECCLFICFCFTLKTIWLARKLEIYFFNTGLLFNKFTEFNFKQIFLTLVGDRPHANDQDREAGLPSKKTALSEKSAEKLMEAIQTYKQYKTECAESLKGNFVCLIKDSYRNGRNTPKMQLGKSETSRDNKKSF